MYKYARTLELINQYLNRIKAFPINGIEVLRDISENHPDIADAFLKVKNNKPTIIDFDRVYKYSLEFREAEL